MQLCEHSKCTGCFACVNICPQKCISMEEQKTESGHIYPVCDEQRCIECGLCTKVCPELNPITLNSPQKTYAAWGKNRAEQEKSASGGIAFCLSKWILEKQGTVYGAAFDQDWNVSHIRVDNCEDLQKLRQSKYVHSWINTAFQNVKKDLEQGMLVGFFGTPCQVAGLKRYLRKDYNNLYTVDLICHGVPSRKLYREELSNLVPKKTLRNVAFRNKVNGSSIFGLFFQCENGLLSFPIRKSYYMRGFLEGLFYRQSCYRCLYAGGKRVGDISLGDFWGIGKKIPFDNPEQRAVSAVLINTSKGRDWYNEIQAHVITQERTLEEAQEQNPQLREPAQKPKNFYKFQKLYVKTNLLRAAQRCYPKMRLRLLLERITGREL